LSNLTSLKESPIHQAFQSYWYLSKIGTSLSAAEIPQTHDRDVSMFTVFGSSDDRVLLTMYSAELK